MAAMKYFDASSSSYLNCSLGFTKELAQLAKDPQGRAILAAAKIWIEKASSASLPLKAMRTQELMNEYIEADFKSIQAAAGVLSLLLIDFDLFRGRILGAISPCAELTAFMSAAEAGLEAKLVYRDSLMFRNNANVLLKAREKNKQENGGTESGTLLQLKSFSPIFGSALKG